MTFRHALAIVVCLAWATFASSAQDQPGTEPYQRVCQACHGELGKGDIAPPLVPGRFDPDYVLAVVREGFGQMPPISTRELTDDEVRAIVSYLASLTPEKPPVESAETIR